MEIEVAGQKYELTKDNDRPVLKMYDKEYKMWVEIIFSNIKEEGLEEKLIELLSKEFMKQITVP